MSIFGSARFKETHPHYKEAKLMAAKISEFGFTILTGGGPGIMQAANQEQKQEERVLRNIELPLSKSRILFKYGLTYDISLSARCSYLNTLSGLWFTLAALEP